MANPTSGFPPRVPYAESPPSNQATQHPCSKLHHSTHLPVCHCPARASPSPPLTPRAIVQLDQARPAPPTLQTHARSSYTHTAQKQLPSSRAFLPRTTTPSSHISGPAARLPKSAPRTSITPRVLKLHCTTPHSPASINTTTNHHEMHHREAPGGLQPAPHHARFATPHPSKLAKAITALGSAPFHHNRPNQTRALLLHLACATSSTASKPGHRQAHHATQQPRPAIVHSLHLVSTQTPPSAQDSSTPRTHAKPAFGSATTSSHGRS